jgi:hypothetical protein
MQLNVQGVHRIFRPHDGGQQGIEKTEINQK